MHFNVFLKKKKEKKSETQGEKFMQRKYARGFNSVLCVKKLVLIHLFTVALDRKRDT